MPIIDKSSLNRENNLIITIDFNTYFNSFNKVISIFILYILFSKLNF